MPPTAEATTGRRRAMASRIEIPCASRSEGSTATSISPVMAATSSRRPVKTIRSRAGAGSAAAWARSSASSEPSPTITSQASGAAQDGRHRVDQVAMPLLRLEAGDHAQQRRAAGNAELAAECAGGDRQVESGQVDPVGNDAERSRAAALGAHLGLDRGGRHDQPIHDRRECRQRGDILRRADARRVDGRHHHRRAGRQRRAGADHLGAVHVGMQEIDLVTSQVGGQLTDSSLVIGLVDQVDLQAQPMEPLHGGPPGE